MKIKLINSDYEGSRVEISREYKRLKEYYNSYIEDILRSGISYLKENWRLMPEDAFDEIHKLLYDIYWENCDDLDSDYDEELSDINEVYKKDLDPELYGEEE